MITEENFLDFKCPACDETVSFPESAIGSVQECPTCTETLVVPEAGIAVGRKLPLPLTTPRLVLRRFTGADWKQLLELVQDEEFFRNMDGLTGQTEEEVLPWLQRDGQIKLTTPNQIFRLALELRDGGKLIGYLGLWFTDAQRLQATFTLSVHRTYQRQGLALEALDAALGFCFEGIHLHRVSVRCDSANAAACRLCENVGMRREGECVKDTPRLEGGWANSVWFAALAEEYTEPDAGTANG
jgi:RimJ/RimL family protein N-acetyltransferase